jgi:hypothetical protein
VALSVVDEISRRVDDRLAELQPAVDEYRELLAIKRGLAEARGEPGVDVAAPARRRSAPPHSRQLRETRADQALRIVGGRPGVTVKEIAGEMGINENYLYRLLPRMEREGRLRREGRGWALAAD